MQTDRQRTNEAVRNAMEVRRDAANHDAAIDSLEPDMGVYIQEGIIK